MTDPKTPQSPTPGPMPLDDVPERVSLIREFWWFLRENKKWWMIPLIVICLLLFGLLLLTSKAGVLAPFIYTLG